MIVVAAVVDADQGSRLIGGGVDDGGVDEHIPSGVTGPDMFSVILLWEEGS
jgi:hypothetical protein